jgi:hypothetical protein
MNTRLRRVLGTSLTLVLIGSCGQTDAPPPQGPLARLAVSPSELPGTCRLRWKTTPYALATTPAEEGEFFAQILSFWFGTDSMPKMDALEAGLSNVYSLRRTDHALVSLTLRFRSADAVPLRGPAPAFLWTCVILTPPFEFLSRGITPGTPSRAAGRAARCSPAGSSGRSGPPGQRRRAPPRRSPPLPRLSARPAR